MKWVTAIVFAEYFNVHDEALREIREKYKNTPYMRQSASKCGTSGKNYWEYDIDFFGTILKLTEPIPAHLIRIG